MRSAEMKKIRGNLCGKCGKCEIMRKFATGQDDIRGENQDGVLYNVVRPDYFELKTTEGFRHVEGGEGPT